MMDMTHIFSTLVQAIDESSFLYLSPKAEYRQEESRAEQHLRWLNEHLNSEEKGHLEQLMAAELNISALEYEALIRLALAAGIRLALVC